MKKIAIAIVESRKFIMIVFFTLFIISLLMIPFVGVNYDLSLYLPPESNTRLSIQVMEEEFSLTSHAQVMVKNIDIPTALLLKEDLKSIDNVRSVIWLDDFIDIYQPLQFYPKDSIEGYYKDRNALFHVEFTKDEYSLEVGEAINQIESLTIVNDQGMVRGASVRSKALRESTLREVFFITIFVLPVFLLILVLTTQSWLEPLVYFIVIGVSVVINMGTNIMFGSISFITISSAAVLQLALSMDYSLFLIHRFTEEKNKGANITDAMVSAICGSFSSLAASGLTTVAGFAALMFMRFSIGKDMSLVLGKGIIISLISAIFLLPCVTILCNNWLEKTKHSSFLPSLNRFSKVILTIKIPILLLISFIIIPAFMAQGSNTFVYGESAIIDDEDSIVGIQQREIEHIFGIDNPLVLLIPTEAVGKEKELVDELLEKTYISSIQGLTTLADPFIPREILPKNLQDNFLSDNFTRFIIGLNLPVESDDTFLAIDDLKKSVSKYYGEEHYLLGSSASVAEIKELVDKDFFRVDMISIIAVIFIMAITFRSLTLPFLLVLVIKSAIWINMSIPYFMDTPLTFIGYMIVSAVQLGATIDYAILLTNRYIENRKRMNKKEAIIESIQASGWAIITSALILFVVGMGVHLISTIGEVSEMGLLIGRGALLSASLVFLVLPQLLSIFDTLIIKSTYGFSKKTLGKEF